MPRLRKVETVRQAVSVVTHRHIRYNEKTGTCELCNLMPGTNARAVDYTTSALARIFRVSPRYISMLTDRGDFGEVKRTGLGDTPKQHRRIEARQLIAFAVRNRLTHLLPAELQVAYAACSLMPYPVADAEEISPLGLGVWFSRNAAGRLIVGTLEGISRAFEIATFIRASYPLSRVLVVASAADTVGNVEYGKANALGVDLIESNSAEEFERLYTVVRNKWSNVR